MDTENGLFHQMNQSENVWLLDFRQRFFGIVIIVQHNLCGTYNFSKLIETRQEGGSTIFDPQ